MILNLKKLNKFIGYKHFKIDYLQNGLELIYWPKRCILLGASENENHQSYLTFLAEKYLNFFCMSNGYGPVMRIFTKIAEILFSVLREKKILSVVYVDDPYIQGDSYEVCFWIKCSE